MKSIPDDSILENKPINKESMIEVCDMIRKAFISLIIGMAYCGISFADNYAILISADRATSNHDSYNAEHWNDLYLIYEYLLLEEHYDSSKVYVFYGDGTDYNNPIERYKKELHHWGQIADYDNYFHTIQSIVQQLNSVVTDEDNILFYWVIGHGELISNSNYDSYRAKIVHNNNTVEYVSKTNLVSLINSITHYNKRKIIWMTCYSGAMGVGSINPNNNKTTIITSSAPDEPSYSDPNHIGNQYYCHSVFNCALFSLSTGILPWETTCNLNQYCTGTALADSLLSLNELYSGIGSFIHNYYGYYQHPNIFDNGNIADRIFIGEEKKLKNVLINNSKSYWVDRIELSDVTFGSNTNTILDIDVQSVIKKNTFVPTGSTLIIK